ncbi:MAG: hypothetical protein HQL15_04260 [Candidatus Omnitrophica bacterium]|nr:hypothetical protein [Candidatus Omnitrophota bacterium]
MKTLKLDQEEKEILEAYERGELKTVKDFKKESKLIRQAAVNTLRKEGIPYQPLIASILHKFVSGRLMTR